MKKLDRKGFTLVELLSVIVITSLVLIVAVYGIFKVKDSAKEKTIKLSLAGIKSSASLYSGEAPSSEWRIEKKEGKESFEYFCVTVGELMNKGIIKKNSVLPDGYDKDTFLFVKRNPLTKDVIGEYLPKEYDENHNICNGYTKVDDELITKYPKITGHKAYTDKLEVDFEKGNIFSLNEDGSKTELKTTYSCEVGTNSRNMSSNNTNIVGNKCIITDLTNNTPYIVRIIMKSDNTIAPTDGNARTADFNDVIFNKDSNQVINIKFNPKDNKNNIINPYYKYFKSSLNATSSVSVKECDSSLNCNNVGTTNIIAGKWYLSSIEEFNLNYELPENNVNVFITARMKDSRNIKEQRSEDFIILADNEKPIINILNKFDGKWSNGKEEEYIYEVSFYDEKSGIDLSSFKYSVGDKQSQEIKNNVISFVENGIVNYKYTVHVNSNQNNTITYEICDNADHCEIASTKVTFDNIPPVINLNVLPGEYDDEKDKGLEVNSTCTDGLSNVNESASSLSTLLVSPIKDEKVVLECFDNAGNSSKVDGVYSLRKWSRDEKCPVEEYNSCAGKECGVYYYIWDCCNHLDGERCWPEYSYANPYPGHCSKRAGSVHYLSCPHEDCGVKSYKECFHY